MALTGTDAQIVRPYRGLLVLLYDNGRLPLNTSVCPYSELLVLSAFTKGYSEGAG